MKVPRHHHRRVNVGDQIRGGGRRSFAMGPGLKSHLHLRAPGSDAHPMEQTTEAGVAGVEHGVE